MDFSIVRKRVVNRYVALLSLLLIMVYIHSRIILIHPLIFLSWPLSLWLTIEVFNRFREDKFKILLFSVTFIIFLMITQLLVVEKQQGIFFSLEPVHNMSTISYIVLAEATLLFLYDSLILQSVSVKDVPAYIGLASVMPWMSPAIIEIIILARWFLNGTFSMMTEGKGIGGASLNDILFYYGGRSFMVSTIIYYTVALGLTLSQRLTQLKQDDKAKRLVQGKDNEWLQNVWDDPQTLLDDSEREKFYVEHGHLEIKQQKEILRKKILPAKGIHLIDPKTLK